MDVHLVDPHDDLTFAAWFAVVDAAHRALRPHEPGWLLDELRAKALDAGGPGRTECLAAVDDAGNVVGSVYADLPVRDNTHLVSAELTVHPEQRRRGAGRALLQALERRALDDSRKVVILEQDETPDSLDSSPGRAFALAHGYEIAQTEIRRDLAVPADEDRLARLEVASMPYASGYRIVTWAGPCPDEFAEARAYLASRMSTDAPMGDLSLEEEDWDVRRLRQREASTEAQGRRVLTAAAVHEATGQLAAYTEIQIPTAVPQFAYQWDTLVLREHRGRRLGTLVKLANLRQLAHASPGTATVMTYNAEENRPMIAINEALGAAVAGVCLEWQKHL